MVALQTDPTRAALLIVAGMASLGLTDNFVPFITPTGSLSQFHLLRGALAVGVLVLAAVFGMGTLMPYRVGAVIGRSLFQAGAMVIYFGCLALLPIGVVVAGLFTAPLFVLLIAVLFQGQRVGVTRWLAIIAGFVGALMVIRPDPAALDWVAFLPVGAGLLYAIGAVATRAWCEGEATLTLTVWFFGVLTVFGGIGVLLLPSGGALGSEGFPLRGWMPLSGAMLGWIVVQAVGSLIGIAFIFRGYQVGEASYVAVFEYSLLVFASLWAWILWGQTVPFLGLFGMVLIAVAGAVIAWRSKAVG